MANYEHLNRLRDGKINWNQWRDSNPEIVPDLSGADLHRADLYERNLKGVNLHGTDLLGADLRHVDLTFATLERARLRHANLRYANLCFANLIEADLYNANLYQAKLSSSNLVKANLMTADLTGTDLSGADLTESNLALSRLVETNLTGAKLNNCCIHGISAWKVTLTDTIQSNLVISSRGEPTITVDNLEVAQFIYLLLNHKRLRDILNSVTQRGVLILGRFSSGGYEVLQSLAEGLRVLKYLPIIFDFDRPDDRNYTETVKTLVGLSRFVIVDLSGPSVPQELYATVPHFKVPFVPVIEKGRKVYSMFVDLLEYPWVIKPPIEYKNKEELNQILLSRIVTPAEDHVLERQKLLDQLFKN